ncbi:unnamed protein product [Clavelina lepadiformis]|uniref:Acidic fibroblast growth factor intracellular-binding protein n=1 Tax=Clavelina lepadiformis TaxID=159417 RepID=A0ABP0FZX8_CLALP
MESLPDVDVFVGNIVSIDFAAYELWLEQAEAEEARDYLMKLDKDEHKEKEGREFLFYSYVLDQFRIFGMLEPMLHYPTMLANQMTYQISMDSQKLVISKYYALDEVVVREFLGKKLNKSTRRDLDEICAKTQKKLKYCQRQFDNCRRIFKAVEDMSGSLVKNIQKHFQLPLSLSWDYAAVVFLANHRFDCSKRKLSCLGFRDFVECSKFLIESWTHSQTDCTDLPQEIDPEFLHDLRSVKILVSEQKLFDKHKNTTVNKARELMHLSELKGSDELAGTQWCEASFRPLSRGIVGIASCLYKSKEIRDYFIDIFEKVVEPCRTCGWDKERVNMFLQCYAAAAKQLPQIEQLSLTWDKYIKTTTKCILQIYKK